jgi:hypothetical protein
LIHDREGDDEGRDDRGRPVKMIERVEPREHCPMGELRPKSSSSSSPTTDGGRASGAGRAVQHTTIRPSRPSRQRAQSTPATNVSAVAQSAVASEMKG